MIASRSMRSLIVSIPTVMLALMLAAAGQPTEAHAAQGSDSAPQGADAAAASVLLNAAAAQGRAVAGAAMGSQGTQGAQPTVSSQLASSGSQGQAGSKAAPASAQNAAAASAAAGSQGASTSQALEADGFAYALNSQGEAAITGYTGIDAQLTIPATLDGHAVVAIADGAFEANTAITGVVVPQGVASIGNRAFADCSALSQVSLPEGLAYLGAGAFSNDDKLSSIVIPASLTSCGASWGQDGTYGPFGGCDGLARIVLAEGSTQVVPNLLLGCAFVQNLVLPQSVASVGADAIDARLLSDKKLTVRGVPGSFAQTYAETAGLAFADSVVHATAVTLDKPSVKTEVGTTTQLKATIEPADYTDAVTWSSSDEAVLAVDATGKVTTKAPGSATVTVQVGEVSASCAFEVVQPVTSITLNKKSLTLEAAETRALQAVVGPENATNKELVWTSSNEKVATVDAQGRVSTLSKGQTTITATAADGYGAKASCTVEVTNTATFASSVAQMASPQGYGNDKDDVWIYRLADAPAISVTFDGRTAVENGYDFIDVYDAQGRLFGRYTGLELAGKTLVLEGDTVRVKLVTDSSDVLWGFGVTDVSPVQTSGWKVIDGVTYYYIDGEPARGELLLSDGWHYFNENTGAMITGLVTLPDGRIVYYDPRGVMQKGEVLLADGWHYFRPSDGSMAIGFTVLPDHRCRYYDHRGIMRVGDVYIGGNLYRFDDATGVLINDVDITDVDVTDVTNITNVQVNVSQTQNNITNVIIQTGDMADDDQEPTPDFNGDDGQGAGTPEEGDGEVSGRPGADGSAAGDDASSSARGDRPDASGAHDAGEGADGEAGGASEADAQDADADQDADAQPEVATLDEGEPADEDDSAEASGQDSTPDESASADEAAPAADGEVGGVQDALSSRADRSHSSDAVTCSDAAPDAEAPADGGEAGSITDAPAASNEAGSSADVQAASDSAAGDAGETDGDSVASGEATPATDSAAGDEAENPLHLAVSESGHVTCDLFEFDVPAAWAGRVDVSYVPAAEGSDASGASDAVALIMEGHADIVLAEFRIADASSPLPEGDMADRLVGTWDNGAGQRIEAWQTSYTYQLWEDAQNGTSTLDLDEAATVELVNLVTGGSATLDAVYAAGDAQTAASLSDYVSVVANSATVPHFDATGAQDGVAAMEVPAAGSAQGDQASEGAAASDGSPATDEPGDGMADVTLEPADQAPAFEGVSTDGPASGTDAAPAQSVDASPADVNAATGVASESDAPVGAALDSEGTPADAVAGEALPSDSGTSGLEGMPSDDTQAAPDATGTPGAAAGADAEGMTTGADASGPDTGLASDGSFSDGAALGATSATDQAPADTVPNDAALDASGDPAGATPDAGASSPAADSALASDSAASQAATTPLELEASQREKIEAMAVTYITAVVDDAGATDKTGNLVTTPGAPGAIDTALVVSALDLVTPNLGTYAAKSTTLTAPNPLNLQVTTAEDGTHVPIATARTILTSFYGSCPDDLSYLGTAEGGFTGMTFTGEEWVVAPVAPTTASYSVRTANYAAGAEGVVSFDCRVTFTTGTPESTPVDKYYHVEVTPDAKSVFGYHMTGAEEIAPVPELA